jgi:glycerate kinase
VPDSFKGSISSNEFCKVANDTITKCVPNAQVYSYPISDGGENSVECLVNLLQGKLIPCKATDSNFFKKQVKYGITDDSAIISVASSSGLANTLIKNPLYTTTYGIGEQIKLAKVLGRNHIYLCLGGSSTNDAGAGLLCALGAKFYNQDDKDFIPTGATLGKVTRMDLTELNQTIKGIKFTALCDVNNPLLGENGCSRVYAKQKGASDEDIVVLEENMTKFANFSNYLGFDSDFSGSGSAGGIGYCVKAFLGGEIKSGIEFFLDSMDFETKAKDCDYIFTGEGSFDNTSIMGKVCAGIMNRCSNLKGKLVVFCGKNNLEYLPNPIYKVVEISDSQKMLQDNMDNADKLLAISIHNFSKEENLF